MKIRRQSSRSPSGGWLAKLATHFRARSLVGVLGGVVAILFCLELVYLAVGNAIVRSQLIKRAVASAEGFSLDYGKAYTLWPGHVRVRELSFRVEDYNIQFEVVLGEATVDIDLLRLPFKEFRVTRLDASGVRYRFRHKLITVGSDAERVAAYPPIRGFADPPYYRGVRPPPIADAEYDLWSLRIENVTAHATELWIMEHRLRGEAVARGSFVIKPARWVQVHPAKLEVISGKLTLGEHVVAERVQGSISCDVPDMWVQKSEGTQVFKEISARIKLSLAEGKLDFLSAYLARLGAARYAGKAEWLWDLDLQRGVIQPGSRVALRAEPFEVHHPLGDLQGNFSLNVARDPRLAPDRLVVALSAPLLTASRAGTRARGPTLEGVGGSLELYATDLTGELSLGAGQVAVKRATAPELAWFVPDGATLGGSGIAQLNLARLQDGGLEGQAHLELDQARFAREDFAARANVQADLAFSGRPSELELSQLELALSQASVRSGSKQSSPFGLRLDGAGIRVRPEAQLEASGPLHLRVSSTKALLPLLLGSPWRDISSTVLDLKALDARAQLQLRGSSMDLRRIDASSGNVRLRGHLSKRSELTRGAFLLSSGLLNVGVTLSDGDTQVSPFVSDNWLQAPAPISPPPSG